MRGRFGILFFTAFAVLIGSPFSRSAEQSAEIRWGTNPARAISEAADSGKPVLVDVWAVWCVPCREMDRTTYRDPTVVSAMDGFVTLKVDHDVQETFIDRHRIEVLPAVLFLDSQGMEITRLSGLVRATPLVKLMETVRAGYAGYVDSMARLKEPAAAESAGAYLLAVGNPRGAADILRRALKAFKDAEPASREKLELVLAEAQLAAGDSRVAAEAFERLAANGSASENQSRALAGLVRAHRERGRTEEADAALARLQKEFPETAAGFGTK